MSVFSEGISVDIPRKKREIGRPQGEKAPADAENLVKYSGQAIHSLRNTRKGQVMSEDTQSPETPESPKTPAESGKPVIQYDDFDKLDLRVGKVTEVAEHPNADKLLVLKVDLGGETRQIIAGIRGHYSPEALLGRDIVMVANLAPRKMRGLESNGMLIAAVAQTDEKSDVVILTTEKPVPPGTPCS